MEQIVSKWQQLDIEYVSLREIDAKTCERRKRKPPRRAVGFLSKRDQMDALVIITGIDLLGAHPTFAAYDP